MSVVSGDYLRTLASEEELVVVKPGIVANAIHNAAIEAAARVVEPHSSELAILVRALKRLKTTKG